MRMDEKWPELVETELTAATRARDQSYSGHGTVCMEPIASTGAHELNGHVHRPVHHRSYVGDELGRWRVSSLFAPRSRLPLSSTNASVAPPTPTAGVAPHHRSCTASHPNPPSIGVQAFAAPAPNYPPPTEALQPANHCRASSPPITRGSHSAPPPPQQPLHPTADHCCRHPTPERRLRAPRRTPSLSPSHTTGGHHPSWKAFVPRNYYVHSCTSTPSRLHRASSHGSASSTSPRSSRPHVGPPLRRAAFPAEHPFAGHRCLLYFIGQLEVDKSTANVAMRPQAS
ncbi:protein transport protein sec31-like [Triticum dicoccoides]|uniref:protein transport protein sec31-like n=1 Tax=Triticum dicoccoides TaxID=85692 RepID=UPI001890F49C|nr:protein transport protein sec31-like [Triticum dicoccoides]